MKKKTTRRTADVRQVMRDSPGGVQSAADGNGHSETPPNIEALAAKARKEREKRCGEAVSKALDDHNCQMSVELQFGQQSASLTAIINLPAHIQIRSK